MLDLKVFINTDDDIRLCRKCIFERVTVIVLRDIKERGRSVESVLRAYNTFSKKAFSEFIKPTMSYADIVIPYGRENNAAVNFVVENIKTRLKRIGILSEEKVALTPLMFEPTQHTWDLMKGKLKEHDTCKDKEISETVNRLLYDCENIQKKYSMFLYV